MSILNALKETAHQSNNLLDLAKLPQAMIMQMAQRGEIPKDMVMPILGKKAEMAENTAKMRAAQELAAQGGQQPTVMEKYMGQIAAADHPSPMQQQMPQQMPQDMAQAPAPQGPEDVGIASQATQPMSMAGGGIVAFGDGGDIDSVDDYQEMQDDAHEAAINEKIYEMIHGLQSHHVPTASNSHTENTGTTARHYGGNENINKLISEKANKYNLPPELLYKIAGSESGGKANAANNLSSAKGIFQFLDSTWKGMGGKPGEQFDPEQNTELGAKYIHQNAQGLKHALGRNPTYGEIYAAHHFGLQGAKDLMGMDPRTPMENAVSDIVIQQNPHLRNRTIGQVMANLSKKTGEGSVSFAKGGIAHFEIGGDIDRVGAELDALRTGSDILGQEVGRGGSRGGSKSPELLSTYENALKLRKEKELEYQNLMEQGGVNKASFYPQSSLSPIRPVPNPIVKRESTGAPPLELKPTELKPIDKTKQIKEKIIEEPIIKAPLENKIPQNEAGIVALKKDKENQDFSLMDYIKAREAKMDKAAEQDKWQAALAAGLGMLGGTSQYALENIGKGGQMGVQHLAAAQKNRMAQEAAMGKLYGTATQNDLMNKLRRDQLDQQAVLKREALGQSKDLTTERLDLTRAAQEQEALKNKNSYIQKRMKDHGMDEMMLGSLKRQQALGKLDPSKLPELQYYEKQMKDIEDTANRLFPNLGSTSGYKLLGVK